MGRGFGTAMQVLAGAFGSGASSLGSSRIEADRNRVLDERADREHQFDVDEAKYRRRHLDRIYDASRADAKADTATERLRIALMGGLTPAKRAAVINLMRARPNLTEEEATIIVMTNAGDVGGTPYQLPPPSRPRRVPLTPGAPTPGIVPPRVAPPDSIAPVSGGRNRGNRPF